MFLVLAALAMVRHAHLCLFIHAFLAATLVFREYIHRVGLWSHLIRAPVTFERILTFRPDDLVIVVFVYGSPQEAPFPSLLLCSLAPFPSRISIPALSVSAIFA